MDILVVTDSIGRQFLGSIVEDKGETIILSSPILMLERVIEPPRVELQFQPVCHTFDVPQIEVRWTSKFLAPEVLVSTYEQFMQKIRAARSGIELATSIPKGLKVVKS